MSEKKLVMNDDALNNVVGGQVDFSSEPAESPSREDFVIIDKVLCPECNEVLLYHTMDIYTVHHSITTDCPHCGKRVTVWV